MQQVARMRNQPMIERRASSILLEAIARREGTEDGSQRTRLATDCPYDYRSEPGLRQAWFDGFSLGRTELEARER